MSNTNSSTSNSDSLIDALSQLRIKLLDLTGRNRLINFKHTIGKSLQFVEGQTASTYKRLLDSPNKAVVKIVGLPEPVIEDWMERNGRFQRPEPKDWAISQSISTSFDINPNDDENNMNFRALMYSDDLAKHCRKIEREATLIIEETGANMLFLVLGFLEFPDQLHSDKRFLAPIVSIPVSMMKNEVNGIQHFSITYTGDDIAENLSLNEKLKNDYGLTLPEFSEVESGDIANYFKSIQQIIDNKPGFILKNRVSLCLLSFSNMLLVRDLDPAKWPQSGDKNGLTDHPIVREVFQGSSIDPESYIDNAQDYLVEEGPAATIPLVYDADSSQHSALIDVLINKKNLVIEGPPGTGKSQTITNLIAACLATGKTILFVAEKLVALEIVKDRLSLAGLDTYILELHSNKTNKKKVLEELARRISNDTNGATTIPELHQQLVSHRAALKAYSDLINSIAHNALGFSLHKIMWRVEKHRNCLTNAESLLSQISLNDATDISIFELNRRLDCLEHLSAQYQQLGGFDRDSTFWGFFPERLIPGDEIYLNNLFTESLATAHDLNNITIELSDILTSKLKGLSLSVCESQVQVLTRFISEADPKLPFDLIPSFFDEDGSVHKAKEAIERFQIDTNDYHKKINVVHKSLNSFEGDDMKSLEKLYQVLQTSVNLGIDFSGINERKMVDS